MRNASGVGRLRSQEPGETTVEVNGTAVAATIVDSTTIRLRAPALIPGPASVVVKTPAGSASETFIAVAP
jgi:uncharacterized protein (TIGR03437 family)